MLLGALIDAGLSPTRLRRALRGLKVSGYRLEIEKVHRAGLQATQVTVRIRQGLEAPLSLKHIHQLLRQSQLPDSVKSQSLQVFDRLAVVEGRVHGIDPRRVRFHEVGVMDSLIDIVGGLLGCHLLNIGSVSASPVNVGAGSISCTHGTLPVPGPAVAELSKQIPIYAEGPQHELTTPTGLAVLTTLTQDFRPLPPLIPHLVGYGAGSHDDPHWPNVLRIFIGKPLTERSHQDSEPIVQLETQLDDVNPQIYEAVIERLFQAGAVDVTLTPTIMKRGRPGILLSALAHPQQVEHVAKTLFEETSTFGVRIYSLHRYVLPRTIRHVKLSVGPVRVKVGQTPAGTKVIPEFQDCLTIAKKTGQPVRLVLEQVLAELRKHPEVLGENSRK
ncbi:MAG: nickel pincer cofactor biosynthesis protein LarC [Nitrospirae bacterium]|nr:MAG: nickel pincer cofactor biosynthesis protein LarC [Nitrospirota bacterium]